MSAAILRTGDVQGTASAEFSGAFSSITCLTAFLPGFVPAFGIIEVLWQYAVAEILDFGVRSAMAAFRFTRSGLSVRG